MAKKLTGDYNFTGTLQKNGNDISEASSVVFTPSGNIAATNVQAAIEELDSEKMNLAQSHAIATL